MLTIILAYLLGILTCLTILLLIALLDWLKDRTIRTHLDKPSIPECPPPLS